MGTRTFQDTVAGTPPTTPSVRKLGGSVDLPLLLIMIVIIVFGLIMVFSASWDFSLAVYGEPMQMFYRQLAWLVVGLVVAFILSRVDYHAWRTMVVPAILMTIGLLAMVLFLDEVRLGAVRTITGGSVQPSELAKLITVIYLAVWMNSKREQMHDIQWGLIPLSVILGTVGGLIYLQPDLSATATVFMLGGLMFFLAGGDLKQIAFLLVVAILVGLLVIQISATGRERMDSYIQGLKDPTQASYQLRRSFEAIVNGGWFGVGLGKADTKLTGLPVPPTDSIFAVIVEELGFFGAVSTLFMYVIIVWRGLRIAEKAPDMLGSLLASGLTFWLATEAAINILVMVGLLPFAGNALPFISAGGSNLVASLAGIGLLMNISRQSQPGMESEEWRSFGASIDLRRRNRRRGLSRLSRP